MRPCKSSSGLWSAASEETTRFLMLYLDKIQAGQTVCVEAINGQDGIVQRLYEMGLLEGTIIEVIGFAPMGDPIEIRLQDFRLSLRRSEAARIQVRLTDPTLTN
jgi:ferrous iron transport protein A